MKYEDKIKIAKKVIGWAIYKDLSIEESIQSLSNRGVFHKEEAEWANKNSDRLVYLNDKFDEEIHYF